MSRLAACLILLSGTLHAGDIEPLVLNEASTNDSSSQEETGSSADSKLLQTVFEDSELADVSVIEPAGTICYEEYCRQWRLPHLDGPGRRHSLASRCG